MRLKHKREYQFLIDLALQHDLSLEQQIFLLAMRETCSGDDGSEFGVLACQNTTLEEQTLWTIGSIKKNDTRWQQQILDKGPIDFTIFFAYFGGPLKMGWCQQKEKWIQEMHEKTKLIEEEFNGSNDTNNLGEDIRDEGHRPEEQHEEQGSDLFRDDN